jgi:hypothetical protein
MSGELDSQQSTYAPARLSDPACMLAIAGFPGTVRLTCVNRRSLAPEFSALG